MKNKNKQDSFQDIVSLFKEDYTAPTRALIWAKVIREWGGIFIAGFLFSGFVLVVVLALIVGARNQTSVKPVLSEITVRNVEPGSTDQQVLAEQKIAPHVKDLLTFITVFTKSLNKRQEIFESLSKITSFPHENDQKALEKKLTSLSIIARCCTAERGKFASNMAKSPNPFQGDIARAVKELFHNTQRSFWEHSETGVPLDPAIETSNWDRLCALCVREVEKVNAALVRAMEQTRL